MTESQRIIVTDSQGRRGTIVRSASLSNAGEPQVLVRFNDGQELLVPADALLQQEDGNYRLSGDIVDRERQRDRELAHSSDAGLVVPVIEETIEVQKRLVETGRVRITKLVHEHEELVDEPLLRERVQVERVPIGRVVSAPVEVRYEGETMIVPVLEEVLVVEKRLMLKEELHITRERTSASTPQHVTLRSEEVVVERVEGQERPDAGGIDYAKDRTM